MLIYKLEHECSIRLVVVFTRMITSSPSSTVVNMINDDWAKTFQTAFQSVDVHKRDGTSFNNFEELFIFKPFVPSTISSSTTTSTPIELNFNDRLWKYPNALSTELVSNSTSLTQNQCPCMEANS